MEKTIKAKEIKGMNDFLDVMELAKWIDDADKTIKVFFNKKQIASIYTDNTAEIKVVPGLEKGSALDWENRAFELIYATFPNSKEIAKAICKAYKGRKLTFNY